MEEKRGYSRKGMHPSGRARHPPGLTGREIGMFYANLDKKNNPKREKVSEFGPNVSVPRGVIDKVSKLLYSVPLNDIKRCASDYENHFKNVVYTDFEDYVQQIKKKKDMDIYNTFKSAQEEGSSKHSERHMPKEIFKQRQKLPAMKSEKEIVAAIKKNQVVLIAGDTGSGKTTQVPQMIMDDFIKANGHMKRMTIICTQPRRLSAIAVAERVAFERNEPLGYSVGYQIRLECVYPKNECGLTFCTPGIILQRMASDIILKGVDIIILDEIHERDVESDLLMCLLKKILPHRPDLRVVLMSATIREDDFCRYFDQCLTFRIDGSLFPVEVLYLEDILQTTGFDKFECTRRVNRHGRPIRTSRAEIVKLQEHRALMGAYVKSLKRNYKRSVIENLLKPESEGCTNLEFLVDLIFYIARNKPEGAILVFLPSFEKISKVYTALQNPTQSIYRDMVRKLKVYALHSLIAQEQQKTVFETPPPGIRKVILATTIAETSVTINDVVYVINPGKSKRNVYDPGTNLQSLEEVWISKANTIQRKGRAGRVQPGICYNLFSLAREEAMDDTPLPAILCSKLDSIILNLKLLRIHDVEAFMESLLTPPDIRSVRNGIDLLKRIEALNDNEVLTPLGMHLARLPIEPQFGKMIFMSALFSCVDPITTAAATVSYKSPFHSPIGSENKVDRIRRELSRNSKSDHLLYHYCLEEVKKRNWSGDYCYKNYLNVNTLRQLEKMKQQLVSYLYEARFLSCNHPEDSTANRNEENTTLLRAVIAAGLYPNIAYLRRAKKLRNKSVALQKISTPEDKSVSFHLGSVNFGELSFDSKYFVYFQKRKSSNINLLEATMVFPMALLIFGDKVSYGISDEGVSYISVGNAYKMKCNKESAELVVLARQRLEYLLQKKALSPSPIENNKSDMNIIRAIEILLSLDDITDMWDNDTVDSDEDDGEYHRPPEYGYDD